MVFLVSKVTDETFSYAYESMNQDTLICTETTCNFTTRLGVTSMDPY
jgi:hypothetical protein